MLNRKFKYKLSPADVLTLSSAINVAFEMSGNSKQKDVQLALCVIIKFRNRLSVNIFGTGQITITLNLTEALAFHVLYAKGIIASNFLTVQVFTPIDRAI